MTAIDWIVLGVIALVVGGAVAFIIREKKKGRACIGCPDSAACHKRGSCDGCHGGCSCAPKEQERK